MYKLYLLGNLKDSSTFTSPAKCITKSNLLFFNKIETFSSSAISAFRKFAFLGINLSFPVIKLSITVTSCPSSVRKSPTTLPIYPAPPVSKIFIK